MKIAIVGQKSFGAAVAAELVRTHHVRIVAGWAPQGDKLGQALQTLGVATAHEAEEFLSDLRAWSPDLIVNAHGHEFITRAMRAATMFGAIGYHPSLLPRHRGRDAIQWTIAMKDPIAGGTVYRLDDGYDTGPILAQDWCHVDPDWDASDLWRNELFPMGVRLLTDVVTRQGHTATEGWPMGAIRVTPGMWRGTPQNDRFATVEPLWAERHQLEYERKERVRKGLETENGAIIALTEEAEREVA